ncbi:class I SAM-dependent methyltransferase [Agromyces lapidis]|uniref:Class I SAM-dependent methyltransferase n=1 Tax=Agromyces lapidis TaxID=279574 RepID=A0ABV5SL78_9MICO|nr:methyltransferase [Agromyces lapidis]
MPFDFGALRRYPDVEGQGLEASDAADRLLLDVAAERASSTAPQPAPDEIVVVDDAYGAIALAAAERFGATAARPIRVHQDLVTGERALAANAERLALGDEVVSMPLAPELVAGARLVLVRLPRSLDRLDELSELVAGHAASEVVIVAAGRLKHMTPAMNEVLGRHFGRVDVSLARQKSRALTASEARPAARASHPGWPRRQRHEAEGLEVVAHGGVFAGTGIDIGTRFLLRQLGEAVPDATRAVDLACGTGIVAAGLASARPGIVVVATDRSAAAVASARLTAEANGVADRVEAKQADGLEHFADASERLIVLNPPFHSESAISTGIAAHLFADAGRVLAPGGELWCVWNSHLRYRPLLERTVGPTRQIARNPKFTITASVRAA